MGRSVFIGCCSPEGPTEDDVTSPAGSKCFFSTKERSFGHYKGPDTAVTFETCPSRPVGDRADECSSLEQPHPFRDRFKVQLWVQLTALHRELGIQSR